MAGYATLAEIVSALGGEDYQRSDFTESLAAAASGVWNTTIRATGMPGPMVNPSAGLAGATAVSKATAGAFFFNGKAAGQKNHVLTALMLRGSTSSTYSPHMYILVDRLAHANVSIVQASGNFAPNIDGTARLASGEGAQIFCEVTTALSAASNTFSLTYTNQDGVTGKTTPFVSTVASAQLDRTPYANWLWLPLAAGDWGVRSIQQWALSSGTATGNINIALMKPVLWLPTPGILSVPTERDYFLQHLHLREFHDSACLHWIFTASSQGVSGSHNGMLRIGQK